MYAATHALLQKVSSPSSSGCQTASHIVAECKYCNGACNGDLHACPGCRIPSCTTISSAQAPQVNMARRREQPCLWLVAPCDVRARRTERKVLSRGGAFLLGGDTPFSLERKWGSHKWGVPLTPPKELSHWKKCPSYQVSRIATFEIWDWGAADPIRVGAHTSLVANWVHAHAKRCQVGPGLPTSTFRSFDAHVKLREVGVKLA